MSALPIVYVVQLADGGPLGDIFGCSVTRERVWFEHVSSGPTFLIGDTTRNFPDRRSKLEAAYPAGYDVEFVGPNDCMPREIAHHFTIARDGAAT